VGLGLLTVTGFGLGLLAGAIWEEPGLVASYVFGGTEEIAWGRERRAMPDVAAPPLPAVRLAVQVGAFADSAAAERLAESLRGKGFSVYVSPGTGAGEARWRVRVGPLTSRGEAERTAARLKKDEKLPTWVLDEDGA
jgi:hypothetical protein